jgi:hypothetical protein
MCLVHFRTDWPDFGIDPADVVLNSPTGPVRLRVRP